MKFKLTRKNAKNKKGKTIKIKKQNVQPQTKTTIQFDTEMQDDVCYSFAKRQYKEQINQLKKFFMKVFQQFEFSSEDTFDYQQILKNIFNFTPISIDRLFNQHFSSYFENTYSLDDVVGYLKVLNNSLHTKQRKTILSYEGQNLYFINQFRRQNNQSSSNGRFISEIQRQVHQNRQNFMEKIKNNQSKYQQSYSQLSEISQELLFLSRIYMENSSNLRKIIEKFNLSHKERLYKNQRQKSTEKLYYQILIKKNINYAFNNENIDYFNYFLEKQIQENNFYCGIKKIQNQDELQAYLKNKKSKKGKSALPTACSCCFSGYFEAYNPLLTCQCCNLRCHKLCFNLKQKSCGHCSYQRILKSQKERIPFCFICKQKGQMTMKIGSKTYAHGFCLLFYNLYQIRTQLAFNQDMKRIYLKKFEQANHEKYQDNKQVRQLSCLKSNIVYFDLEKISKSFLSASLVSKTSPDQQLMPFNYIDQNQERQNSCCQLCYQKFEKSFYSSCKYCHKKYHGYCAFFGGFEFQLQKDLQQVKANRQRNVLNCCQKSNQQRQHLRTKRKFILNKDRYLFQSI